MFSLILHSTTTYVMSNKDATGKNDDLRLEKGGCPGEARARVGTGEGGEG